MVAAPSLARPPAPSLEQDVGPGGDYPVLIGEPFVVDGTTYTPADTMNYDAVGYVAPTSYDGALVGVSGAHRTLPIPSYVEVTSLDTGRTALVRLEQRGPMSGNGLITLSDMARGLIGITPDAQVAVRVRRVNPPEQERALLRTGQPAPLRMDTPLGLLTALRRKLGIQAAPAAAPNAAPYAQATAPTVLTPPVKAATTKIPKPAPNAPSPKPAAIAKSPTVSVPPVPVKIAQTGPKQGGLLVQVGAYASRASALAVAKRVGGSAVQAGKVWRVRIGQLSDRKAADAALAKARSAGYAGARILTEH